MIDLEKCIIIYDSRTPSKAAPDCYLNFWNTVMDEQSETLDWDFGDNQIGYKLKKWNARPELSSVFRDEVGLFTLNFIIFDTPEDKLAFILEWS